MSEPETQRTPDPALTGLGGWLVLPCIGLFLTVIMLSVVLVTTFLPIFTDGTWAALTTPGAEAYHPMWGPLLLTELVLTFAQVILAIYLLVLFFTQHRFFPKGMIAFYLFAILVQFIDMAMISAIPAGLVEDTGPGELLRSMVIALIWCSYFVKSERVKNTFVK